jgi:hypothetical protein
VVASYNGSPEKVPPLLVAAGASKAAGAVSAGLAANSVDSYCACLASEGRDDCTAGCGLLKNYLGAASAAFLAGAVSIGRAAVPLTFSIGDKEARVTELVAAVASEALFLALAWGQQRSGELRSA